MNLESRKRLGQHFLASPAVLEKIVRAASPQPGETILEIGAGHGELTRALAKRGAYVIAVEKDIRLTHAFEFGSAETRDRITLVTGDILKLFPHHLPLPSRYRVVANIPYYLTSRLIRVLLESPHPPEEMLLMVQREVADRITAKPPRMNLLAIGVQAYGTPEILFTVPARAFRPQPNVDSALIRIAEIGTKFFDQSGIDAEWFFSVVRAAFQGKRKLLTNSIAKNLKLSKPLLVTTLRDCRIRPNARPEELALEAWGTLTCALQPMPA